jgi:hypothetical protein
MSLFLAGQAIDMNSSTVLVCVVGGAGDGSTLWHSPQSRAVSQNALTGDGATFSFGSSPEPSTVCAPSVAVIGGGSFAELCRLDIGTHSHQRCRLRGQGDGQV